MTLHNNGIKNLATKIPFILNFTVPDVEGVLGKDVVQVAFHGHLGLDGLIHIIVIIGIPDFFMNLKQVMRQAAVTVVFEETFDVQTTGVFGLILQGGPGIRNFQDVKIHFDKMVATILDIVSFPISEKVLLTDIRVGKILGFLPPQGRIIIRQKLVI